MMLPRPHSCNTVNLPKVIISIDIGTTFSGASFCIPQAGTSPEIHPITRFPHQGYVRDSRIPSIIWYDDAGEPRAIGAEAVDPAVIQQAIEEGWRKVIKFKFLLSRSSQAQKAGPPLPPGKSPVAVYADFIRYLYQCAKQFIIETHQRGSVLFTDPASCERIHIVLSHPNGWDGEQQAQLRKAAVLAEVIPDNYNGHQRLLFMTEGEASFHYCLQNGLHTAIQTDRGILIIDAGGGTIDMSAYAPTTPHPRETKRSSLTFKELARPCCLLSGATFVTDEAERYLTKHFIGSQFSSDIAKIVERFDKTAKVSFRSSSQPLFIEVGRDTDHNATYKIKNGQLRLSGEDVADFFRPSIKDIVQAVRSVAIEASVQVSVAFLVGGFGNNDFLFAELKKSFEHIGDGIQILRPDIHLSKAVSDGAIGCFINHHVTVRVSQHCFGTYISIPFVAGKPEHEKRRKKIIYDRTGRPLLPQVFHCILSKGTEVQETRKFTRTYKDYVDFPGRTKDDILQYVGTKESPEWIDEEPEKYIALCSIEMSAWLAGKMAQRRVDEDGDVYFKMKYDIILHFGLTELTALFAWMEDGKEVRTPAKIVYPGNLPSIQYLNFE